MAFNIDADDIGEIIGAMHFLRNQKLLHDYESHKAEALHNRGFLGSDDVVWTVAAGPFGAETVAYGRYAGMSIGIDPRFPNEGMVENCYYFAKTLEEVLTYESVPQPTLVISNRYSGINSVLSDILELETEPTCIFSPCSCNSCVEEYYLDARPRSRYFRENFPGMGHIDLDSRDPAGVDVLDMAETGRESGYLAHVAGFPVDEREVYFLFLTKNEALYDFVKAEVCGLVIP